MTTAPEIDPAGAMAGLTLLVGGLAVLRGRRSKK
jgi:LPXTG-motif cell wall-anchored protein